MAFSARILATNALYQYFQQGTAFTRGDIVRYDGMSYVPAQANNAANAVSIGMISAVKTAGNEYYLTQAGFVYGLTTAPVNPGGAYIPGTLYYLSDTNAGKLTATPPVIPSVVVPIYVAVTATSGYFLGNYGVASGGGGGGSSITWSTIAANQTLVPDHGYFIAAPGALNNLLLPAAMTMQQQIQVVDYTGFGFTLTQSAGQTILVGSSLSTMGVGGSVQSTSSGTGVTLQCITANTAFWCDPRNSTLVVT